MTGHSLGGHLAAALTRLVPGIQALTINGAGFATGYLPGLGGDAAINIRNLFGMLGGEAAFDSSRILNLYGDKMPEFVTQNNPFGLVQQGRHEPIFIEQPDLFGNTLGHGSSQMVDSLAVYDLLTRLDSGLNLATLLSLVESAANDPRATLEAVIRDIAQLADSDGPLATDDREAFYRLVNGIWDSSLYRRSAGLFQVRATEELKASATAGSAAGLAYRYALTRLNPFAVVGDSDLYVPHNADAQLDLYDPATRTGRLTREYLQARGEMLTYKLIFDRRDIAYSERLNFLGGILPAPVEGDHLYHDLDSGVTLDIDGINPGTVASHHIGFGGMGSDSLTGGRLPDRLFGGGGRDSLTGLAGDDYLEGGLGDDLLVGGRGDDRLVGGDGNDLYAYTSGDGSDRIQDSDGAGGIMVDARLLGTDIRQSLAGIPVYLDDRDYHYSRLDGELFVELPDGQRLTIENYRSGDLGLTLQAPAADPQPMVTLTTADDYRPPSSAAGHIDAGAGADMLHGSAGDDRLLGGGGDDWISGNGGRDRVTAGAGNDQVTGLHSGSIASGGSGDDLLSGAYRDVLSIDRPAEAIGASAFWADFTHAYPLHRGELALDRQGFLFNGQGIAYGAASGTSSLGQGWSYDFEIAGDGRFRARYFHPQQAPAGIDPAADWGHSIEPFDDGIPTGVFLFGDAGSDLLVGSRHDDVLSGGTDDDQLFGHGGDDILSGGDGRDVLAGGDGNDLLRGGDRNDRLYGETGRDRLFGGGGNDELLGDALSANLDAGGGSDTLSGGVGDDTLYGQVGADTLLGGDGDDWLTGDMDSLAGEFHGADRIEGGRGDDILLGNGGDDLLIGGAGTDAMDGGDGNDSYLLSAGDGPLDAGGVAESIDDGAGNDRIRFGAGIRPDALQTWRSGRDLSIRYGDGDWLYLRNGLDGSVEQFQFDDGTVLDWMQFLGRSGVEAVTLEQTGAGAMLVGGSGDDSLRASGGSALLSGGRGDDSLSGSGGNNLYLYHPGDGVDRIRDSAGQTDPAGAPMPNTLRFGSGITAADLVLTGHLSGALEIQAGPTGDDRIYLDGFDASDPLRPASIDRFEFADGSALGYHQLLDRGFHIADAILGTDGNDRIKGTASDDFIQGLDGRDTLRGMLGDDILDGGGGNDDLQGGVGNDTLLGGDGNDRLLGYLAWESENDQGDDLLYGGPGNDRMFGGRGNDTYLFGRGDGSDEIGEANDAGVTSTDTLRLGSGVLPGQVTLHHTIDFRGYDDLILAIDAGPTQLKLNSHYGPKDTRIERIEFDNGRGPVWTAAEIEAHVEAGTRNDMTGGPGDDHFVVDHEQDRIVEAVDGGIDSVTSSRGYTLPDNVENLTLTGFLNLDITGNGLNNILTGNSGDNRLDGKGGNDTGYGGPGNDYYRNIRTVVEHPDEGIDTVVWGYGGTLPDNVENLYMNDRSSSHPFYPLHAYGNELDNVLISSGRGFSGDVLDGRGGADTMIGEGLDSIIFYVDDPGDRVIGGGGSSDEIRTTVDYALPRGVDRLILLGNAAISGTGGDWNDLLDGSQNPAANRLLGGKGDDRYILGAGDLAIERADEGIDRVELHAPGASRLYDLQGTHIEHLQVYDEVGMADILGSDAANNLQGNNQPNLLRGGAGDDILSGNGNRDYLDGGPGNDRLYGDTASDGLDGREGDDTLVGGDGDDHLSGDADDDDLRGDAGRDWLRGGSGDDRLRGGTGRDWLVGGSGQDHLEGGPGEDWLRGDEGGDLLQGGGDRDWLQGGAGDDRLEGGAGRDRLDGDDGNDLLDGGLDNDHLEGGGGDDRLQGGAGQDMVMGGAGNDCYLFDRGDGVDLWYEDDATAGNQDSARFGAATAVDQLWFLRRDNNLEIQIIGTGDRAVIGNWYQGTAHRIERFEAGGRVLTDGRLDQLVQAMASFSPPEPGQTQLPETYREALEPVLAASWQ